MVESRKKLLKSMDNFGSEMLSSIDEGQVCDNTLLILMDFSICTRLMCCFYELINGDMYTIYNVKLCQVS